MTRCALLSVAQVAERLGTPQRFVRRLIHEHRIAYSKVGRYVRISETDLEAFVAAGRVDATVGADLRLVPTFKAG